VTWIGPADQGYIAIGSGAKVLISSFDPLISAMVKPTIVRTRGVVSYFPSFGASLSFAGAFGMAVVTDRAVAAGVVSLPDPVSDSGWDGWFVWRSFANRVEFDTAAGVELAGRDFEVDSKAMRKMTDDETLIMIAASQSGAFSLYDGTRTLFMLS